MKSRLVQIAPGLNPGDAITNEIRLLDQMFRTSSAALPFQETAIFAENIGDVGFDAGLVRRYRPRPDDVILYHYGIASGINDRISSWSVPRFLMYHNVTPAKYFRPYSLFISGRLERARRELRSLRRCFEASFAVSRFNASELQMLGYDEVAVLPLLFPFHRRQQGPSPRREPVVLFVGRIAPNKGLPELFKIFYYLRRLRPELRLVIAGTEIPGMESFRRELDRLRNELRLNDAVELRGYVSDDELQDLYARASMFLSASRHEGFGVPLLEAMRAGLPVLAYAGDGPDGSPRSAVEETLDGAGVLFRRFDPVRVAELAARILDDADLNARIVDEQRRRLERYDADAERIFENFAMLLARRLEIFD